MTNPTHEPEEQGPQKRVRIILAREVCTTPEETANLLHQAIMKALDERDADPDSRHLRGTWSFRALQPRWER